MDVTYYQLELYHKISELFDRRSPDNNFMIISDELKHGSATSGCLMEVLVETDLVYDEK